MTEILVPNLLVSITGKPKSGKTHLACTFAAPIKIYSFDLGAKYVANKFKDKQIDVLEFDLPIIETTDSQDHYATPVWKAFETEYNKDTESNVYKTLVLDTATAVWSFCRQAITEEKNRKKLLEIEYAKPNLKMSSLFAKARVGGKNLVTIQYLRDQYIKGEATGEKELDGWKYTESQSDLILEISRVTAGEHTVMKTLIKDNRFDRNINGKVLVDTDYEELVALMGV